MRDGTAFKEQAGGLWNGSICASDQCGQRGKKSDDWVDAYAGSGGKGRGGAMDRDDEPAEGRGGGGWAYLFPGASRG